VQGFAVLHQALPIRFESCCISYGLQKGRILDP